MASEVKLTQTVKKGGCAAKVAAESLREILAGVTFPPIDSSVIVDGGTFDDAAIYKITDDVALVQTLDFFTPIVDDPYQFGQVAAANSLSDVYAMGGEPKTAMAILAFPLAILENSVITQVLQGASDKIKEAGANFVGGHSIDDETLKFGLSVTGTVHPNRIWTNSKARVGDRLILTKAIGTGTLMAGLKKGVYTEAMIDDALRSMAQLNRVLDLLSEDDLLSIHAATDVTGFGLAGHGMQLAEASNVSLAINIAAVPRFYETDKSLEMGNLTKAHASNRSYTLRSIAIDSLSDVEKLLAFDPQTSGGLLLSVAASQSGSMLAKLRTRFGSAEEIGEVVTAQAQRVLFQHAVNS